MLLRQPTPATGKAAPSGPVPADVRAMNAAAALALALAVVAALAMLGVWLASRPAFAIDGIRLEGDLQRNSVTTLRAGALPRLAGNFFTMDLQKAREAFEQVPWVRRATVRRVWPDRLVVTLEEHQPVALWAGDQDSDKMVNSHGEVFEANVGDVEDDSLPELSGPDGSSAQVLAMYRRLQPVLGPLGGELSGLALSGRGSWRVELDSGATVEVGRGTDEEVLARAARFVRTLPQVTQRFKAPLESADLRHAEGYAVKLKGVTVDLGAGAGAPAKPAAREE